MVQFLVGYFLMLVAMTYNVWLFLAVIIGCGIGYFLATPYIEYYFDLRKKAASQVLDNYGKDSFGSTGTLWNNRECKSICCTWAVMQEFWLNWNYLIVHVDTYIAANLKNVSGGFVLMEINSF